MIAVEVDETGFVAVHDADGRSARLHPLWLRERTNDSDLFDAVSRQRHYDPTGLPADLRVLIAAVEGDEKLTCTFSDGRACAIPLRAIETELGWRADRESPPSPEPWTSALSPRPEYQWHDLESPSVLRNAIGDFFRLGFCVFRGAPTAPGSLRDLASRFGYIRETHWGTLFDVIAKPRASDIAYTPDGLAAHTDNPYRRPIPGVQFLHCLENSVSGGKSTLVDGLAIAVALADESPALSDVLATTPVRFRYEGEIAILENEGPLIERDAEGAVRRVRLSSRLDYPPPLDVDRLEQFYAARRRLHQLAHDPAFEIRYTFEPGLLLMMDNYRTLHGRTPYNAAEGRRHLQGCYIDHDGPDCLYRLLVRDGHAAIAREVA